MSVGLVIVSHSRALAEGVVELATQMAPEVRVVAAGGLPGGELGTDFETTSAALSDADSGSGAVLLYDLGSAQMTAELAVEALGDPSTVLVAEAPLVEGAVAAAVAAQGDEDLAAVARAAELASSGGTVERAEADRPPEPGGEQPAAEVKRPAQPEVREELILANEIGLHARPAALVARSLTGLQAEVTVSLRGSDADARSVLAVMGLGARKDDRVRLHAAGPDANEAVRRIRDLAERNFEE